MYIYKRFIEKSLPNYHKLTTETSIFEVKTVKGGRRSTNYVHFYKAEEHPNLERKSEREDLDSASYHW